MVVSFWSAIEKKENVERRYELATHYEWFGNPKLAFFEQSNSWVIVMRQSWHDDMSDIYFQFRTEGGEDWPQQLILGSQHYG